MLFRPALRRSGSRLPDRQLMLKELHGFALFFEPLTATKLPTTAACGAATKLELSKNVSDFLRQTS